MKLNIIKINKNKSGSGSVSSRIVLPASWVKDMGLEDKVLAYYDKENKRIVLKKEGK